MVKDRGLEGGSSTSRTRGLYERFATLIRVDCVSILASYLRLLEGLQDTALFEDGVHDHAVTSAELIADLAERVEACGSPLDARDGVPVGLMTETQAHSQLGSTGPLRAAALFNTTVASLAQHVEDSPELLPCFVTAVLTLQEQTTMQAREAMDAHTRYLLDRLHRERLDERRHLARELHDRLGEGLSVALRQLELCGLAAPDRHHELAPQSTPAREALVEAMRRLRLLTSDLREDPVTSLEKALAHYVDTVTTDTEIRLRVSGDERQVPSFVIDEAHLIIREAIRNALTHATPRLVLIDVDIEQPQLKAVVKDDGCGFVLASVPSGTAGLATMRERVFMLKGRLTVNSVPGHGTSVCLVVPLQGPRDDQSR